MTNRLFHLPRLVKLLITLCLGLCAFMSFSLTSHYAESNRDETGQTKLSQPEPAGNESASNRIELNKLELNFIPNRGQYPDNVKFASQATGQDLFFSPAQILFSLRSARLEKNESRQETAPRIGKTGDAPSKYDSRIIKLDLLNSDPKTEISGETEKAGKFNYFKGSDP